MYFIFAEGANCWAFGTWCLWAFHGIVQTADLLTEISYNSLTPYHNSSSSIKTQGWLRVNDGSVSKHVPPCSRATVGTVWAPSHHWCFHSINISIHWCTLEFQKNGIISYGFGGSQKEQEKNPVHTQIPLKFRGLSFPPQTSSLAVNICIP